jgi:VWFA-related protein
MAFPNGAPAARNRQRPFWLVTIWACCGAIGFAAAAGFPGRSQKPDVAPQTPVYRTSVELVNVAVNVVDSAGKPVKDLDATDFELYEGGRRQVVQVFQRVVIPSPRRAGQGPASVNRPTDVASNESTPEVRAFLILLDDIHISALRTPATRQILADFVSNHVGHRDLVSVMCTTGQPAVTLDFTAEKSRVLSAISRFSGLQPPGEAFLDPAADARSTMNLVERAAQRLAGAAAPRVAIVFVSEGVRYDTDKMTDPASSDITRAMQTAVEALKRSNVVMYAIDPRGLSTRESDEPNSSRWQQENGAGLPRPGGAGPRPLADALRISIHSLTHLSEATGGFALVNSNDYGRDMDRVVEDAGVYYLLGYQPTPAAQVGEYRSIDVKVNRSRVRISARQGYVRQASVTEPFSGGDSASPALAALGNMLPKRDLPLRVQPLEGIGVGEPSRVYFLVEASGVDRPDTDALNTAAERVDLASMVIDGKGRPQGSTTARIEVARPGNGKTPTPTRVIWVSSIALPPGRFGLRVAAHATQSRRTGSVFSDLDVSRRTTGAAVSSLVVATGSPDQPVLVGEGNALPQLPYPPTTARVFQEGDTVFVGGRVQAVNGSRLPASVTIRIRRSDAAARSADELEVPLNEGTGPARDFVTVIETVRLRTGRFVLTVELPDAVRKRTETSRRTIEFDVVSPPRQ